MLKTTVLIAALALAGAVQAQTASPPPESHSASTPPASPPARPHYSVDATPIETLEADPEAKALVIKHFASLFDHPAYSMFKSMTLKAIEPYSQGSINDQTLSALQADLDALR